MIIFRAAKTRSCAPSLRGHQTSDRRGRPPCHWPKHAICSDLRGQVEGLPVYGVAIPTVAGLRNVLTFIGGKYRRAVWHNMREVCQPHQPQALGGRPTRAAEMQPGPS